MRNKNHALYFDEKIKITKRVAKFMIFIKMIAKNVSDLTGFFCFCWKETRKFFPLRARVKFGLLNGPFGPAFDCLATMQKKMLNRRKYTQSPKKPVMKLAFFGL